jgi:hypothetical protein
MCPHQVLSRYASGGWAETCFTVFIRNLSFFKNG